MTKKLLIYSLVLIAAIAVMFSCNQISKANSQDESISMLTRVVEVSDGCPVKGGMNLDEIDVLTDYEMAFNVAYPILSHWSGHNMGKYYPYRAYLYKDSVWIISGSVLGANGKPIEGGAPYIELSKHDGRVLKIIPGSK